MHVAGDSWSESFVKEFEPAMVHFAMNQCPPDKLADAEGRAAHHQCHAVMTEHTQPALGPGKT